MGKRIVGTYNESPSLFPALEVQRDNNGRFRRRKQDAYDSPPSVVAPLLRHLEDGATFEEPCAGKGNLIDALNQAGNFCVWACDIEPRRDDIEKMDALDIKHDPTYPVNWGKYFITNPPWTRHLLHPIIEHLSDIAPTWLLFDADWMHTIQAVPYLVRCRKIVSVGRVSWMGNRVSGLDNCAWYLFDAKYRHGNPNFYGR